MSVTDLNEVVERSIMIVQHHLKMASVELHTELLDGDPRVVADGAQLQQALVALFVNAVEAMKESGQDSGKLSVRLDGSAEEVGIHVEDNGVGIPPDVLPQIFEPFFSTKHRESGVGLGLAVVYGIVERHGGRIEVQSEVHRGTTFHVRLPRTPRVQESETINVATDSRSHERIA